MDPDIVKELNESLRELNDALRKQSSELMTYTSSLTSINNNTNNNTNAAAAASKANNSAAQSTTKYSQTVTAVDEALKKGNADFSRGLKNTGEATVNFGKALISAETSLTKYGASANQLGGAAWDIGKNFGLLGMAVGGALAVLGLAANSILTLNQNIIDFRDGFTKQAGVLPITTENLGKLASEAGFAYNRMPMLAKAVQNLGPSLLSLGGYAGEGAVRFMNIANVGEETRKRFSRMGLQQEDLLQYQSYYIELQRAGGQSQENKRKTDQQIQRESLLYAENLLVLSGLTGEKAETIKDRQQQEMLKLEEQSAILAENEEIKRLRALGTAEANAKAEEIAANQKLRRETIEALAGQGREAEAFAAGSLMRLGSYTDATAKYANAGFLQQTNALKRTRDVTGFIEDITSTQMGINERMNTATQFVADAADQMGGLGHQSLITVNRIGNDLRESTERLRNQQNEKGAEGTDTLADTAASIQELEILASQKFQAFLETIDPLRHGFEKFKDAAIIAAAALGGGALIAGVAKGISLFSGDLGSARNPMHAKIVSSPGDVGTGGTGKQGIGARLKGLFSKTAAPTAAAAGVGAGPLAKGATGASALSNAAGSAGGSKVGIFLMGLSQGLSAIGKASVHVVLGAGAVGAAIALIGAGIAGATWIIGKSLPSLAEGLTAFNTVNGDKLEKIGIGMAGMAAGLLAIGASSITDAIGNIAQWATGDNSNPVDNLQKELTKFQEIKVDSKKVEYNSRAFIAFNKMLAQATEINGTIAGALSRAFGSFFEVDIPLDKFKDFSDLDINAEQVGKNATAFKLFSEAMDSYKGVGTLDALGIISQALSGSVFSFYKSLPTDDPIKRFEKFSKVQINGAQAAINAAAFKDFANAMAEYKGGPGVIDALSQLAGGALMSLFNVDGPIDTFRKFAQEDFGPNMEKNTEAFAKYANSGGRGSGVGTDNGGDTSSSTPTESPPAAPSPAPAPAASSEDNASPAPVPTGGGTPTAATGGGDTTTAAPTGPAPVIGAGRDAVLNYAQSLGASDRAAFYRSLVNQGMQRAAAARAAGNSAQASLWERAANQYHLASEAAESAAQTENTSSGNAVSSPDSGGRTGMQLATISAQGKSVQVAAAVAPKMQQVIDRMTSVGYRIKTLHGYNDRNIARTNIKSAHSRGWAIDVNPEENPHTSRLITDMPGDVVRHARSIGLGWGGDWRSSKDAMHFSAQKNEGGYLRAQAGGVFSGSPAMVGAGIAEAQKIGMLNPQSLISKLGKTSIDAASELANPITADAETDLTPELLTMIEGKLEKVLYALENNQYTHEKILKNSM
jgi:hypothetical protein